MNTFSSYFKLKVAGSNNYAVLTEQNRMYYSSSQARHVVFRAIATGSDAAKVVPLQHNTDIYLQAYDPYGKRWITALDTKVGQSEKCHGSKTYITFTTADNGVKLKIRNDAGKSNNTQVEDGTNVTLGGNGDAQTNRFLNCDQYIGYNQDKKLGNTVAWVIEEVDSLPPTPSAPPNYTPPDDQGLKTPTVGLPWYFYVGLGVLGLVLLLVLAFWLRARAKRNLVREEALAAKETEKRKAEKAERVKESIKKLKGENTETAANSGSI